MLRWSIEFVLNPLRVLSKNKCLRWNHYKSLGLTPSATAAEVKAAYYKLSKLYHPDRNNGSEACAKKFRDIVAAYEVLSRAETRKQYDREIHRKFMTINPELSSKKKPNRRFKKSSPSPKSKSHFKTDLNAKWKQKSGGEGRKGMKRHELEDVENFLVRVIPVVIACLMRHKK